MKLPLARQIGDETDPRAFEPFEERSALPRPRAARRTEEEMREAWEDWEPRESREAAQFDGLSEHREEVEALLWDARRGLLPRNRRLKEWEPQLLSERHLMMVMMRAQGFHQRTIARTFGAADATVSVVLGHPDAETLLVKLAALRICGPSALEERLRGLSEPAIATLEDAFFEEDPELQRAAVKKSTLAFRVLDMNGYAAPKKVEQKVEVDQQVTLKASEGQLGALVGALKELKELPAAREVLVVPAPPAEGGGGS